MRRRVTRLGLFLLLGLVSTVGVTALVTVLVDVSQGPQSQAESLVDDERWTVTRWDRAGAAQIRSVRIRGPRVDSRSARRGWGCAPSGLNRRTQP